MMSALIREVVIERKKVICQGYFGHEIHKLWYCIVLGKGCFPTPLVSTKMIFFKVSCLLSSSFHVIDEFGRLSLSFFLCRTGCLQEDVLGLHGVMLSEGAAGAAVTWEQ